MNPLAITGVGVASPLGIGRAAFTQAIRSDTYPAYGERPVETLDAAKYPRARIAEVSGFDATKFLGEKGLRSLDRLTKLLVVAARLALHDAGLKRDCAWAAGSPDRVGLVVSNAYGSLEAITELDRVAILEDARYINPSRFPLTVSNTAAGYVSIWEDLRALNVSVSDGNCGALDAVACASLFLEQSRAAALLVGGAEAMSEALVLGFDRLGAFSHGACIGEGAALFAVESQDVARARRASVLSTITGYGTAFAAPPRQASLLWASSEAVERAIVEAIGDAGIDAGDIGLVVSGIAGIKPFDEAELLGIEHAVGRGTCVVAPKLALGETLGASGAMAILAAIALASPGAARAAPSCQSLVVRGALRAEPRTVVVTSMGHYGNASALVMSAPSR